MLDLTVQAARSATGLRQVTTYAGQPYWLDLEFGTPSVRPGSIELTLPIAWLGVYVLPQLPDLSHVAVGGGAVSLAAWAADKALGGALGQVGKDLMQRIYEGVQRLRGLPEMPKERRGCGTRPRIDGGRHGG